MEIQQVRFRRCASCRSQYGWRLAGSLGSILVVVAICHSLLDLRRSNLDKVPLGSLLLWFGMAASCLVLFLAIAVICQTTWRFRLRRGFGGVVDPYRACSSGSVCGVCGSRVVDASS